MRIDSVAVDISGAALTISPDAGYLGETTFTVTGSGFTPFQMVTLWLTMPPLCDASAAVWAMSAAYLSDVKADASGHISDSFYLVTGTCEGTYGLTAREVKSDRGAITSFKMTGKPIAPTYGDNDTLVVSPGTVNAGAFFFEYIATVSGSGFKPGEVVSCWVTRPDAAVALGYFGYGFDTKADAAGHINAPMVGSDLSSLMGTGEHYVWSAI